MSKAPKRPHDVNQLAKLITDIALAMRRTVRGLPL